MDRKQQVVALHRKGYNCSQAFISVYQDILDIDQIKLFRLSEGLGRGVAGLEELCIVPVMMAMICSYIETSDGCLEHPKTKLNSYACGKCLAMDFKEQMGSLHCHELLKINQQIHRDCSEILKQGVDILDACLK